MTAIVVYIDVKVNRHDNGFSVEIEKKKFEEPVTHYPEEYNFPDRLYQDYWEHAYAWGVVVDNKLIAAIETNQELPAEEVEKYNSKFPKLQKQKFPDHWQ